MSSTMMDWEPTENDGMDIDDLEYYSEVHMASPIEDTFFLPPLEFNTKPLAFPPLEFPAWEHKRNIPLTAISVQSSTTPAATSQGVTHKSALANHVLERSVTSQHAKTTPSSVDAINVSAIPSYVPKMRSYHPKNLATSPSKTRVTVDQNSPPPPSNFDCLPICLTVAPPSSKSRTNPRPIPIPVVPISLPTISEETLLDGHSGDTPPATLRPPIKTTVPAERPHRTIGNDNIALSDGNLSNEIPSPPGWLDWAVEQDLTPSTPHPIFAETNTPPGWPDWMANDDTTPVAQYPVLESTTPSPQTTTFQEYVDPSLDLIGLFTPNSSSSNPSNLIDESAFRAFGGSSLEDLDWILEGFRATNITFESVNHENKFAPAPRGNFSPVSPYDWAPVSDLGPDLITFDSTHDLSHRSAETPLVLATTLSGSFELPFFKSGDDVQTESNRRFRMSTPACDRLATCAVVVPTLENANTPEIVITTCNSPSSIHCSPLSDPSHSPFHPMYHDSNVLAEFSKIAYTVERNALRNVKAFKNKLSFKVQKLQVGTKTSVATQNDIDDAEHDVFGEIAKVIDKRMARSTKVDASTQTEKLASTSFF